MTRGRRLLEDTLRTLRRRRAPVAVWYSPAYRLPVASLEARTRFDPRRADRVAWLIREVDRTPTWSGPRASYTDIGRVHGAAYLEAVTRPEALARIFAVGADDVPVDEVLRTVRAACGGTVAGARWAVAHRGAALNLLGGFHHAHRGSGGGFCVLNDIAIAVAALRADGFRGLIGVLDLDAHPPDGLADTLADDPACWIGSISGSDWGPLVGVDETLLPAGTGDVAYLEALDALLRRAPLADLTFVIAGGDVLEGDALGRLALSLAGARERDLRIIDALGARPSVWLPGGGYGDTAWMALAGTWRALRRGSRRAIRPADPLSLHFARLSRSLDPHDLGDDDVISEADLAELVGASAPPRLLGFYTAEGIELGLWRYGILPHLRRLGYDHFEVLLDRQSMGDRFRLFGDGRGSRHLLAESVLGRTRVQGRSALFIHWLTLRHPLVPFSGSRPQLPGQDVPGLGLALEAAEMHVRMAERLGLDGIAFRPAAFHVAYSGRRVLSFTDVERQARFQALIRDLGDLPLLRVTRAIDSGRVLMDGAAYAWEPDEMVAWLDAHATVDPEEVARAMEKYRFELAEGEGQTAME